MILLSIFTLVATLAQAGSSLENYTTDDWSATATEARKSGLPIMIVFSAYDCSYCEHLKDEILDPAFSRVRSANV